MLSQSLKNITIFYKTAALHHLYRYDNLPIFLALAAYLVFLNSFEPPAGWTLLAVLILFATECR